MVQLIWVTTLARVKAWCLAAPSLPLNQCCVFNQRYSVAFTCEQFKRRAQSDELIYQISLKVTLLKLRLLGAVELIQNMSLKFPCVHCVPRLKRQYKYPSGASVLHLTEWNCDIFNIRYRFTVNRMYLQEYSVQRTNADT